MIDPDVTLLRGRALYLSKRRVEYVWDWELRDSQ
jgi:hypothetical protein